MHFRYLYGCTHRAVPSVNLENSLNFPPDYSRNILYSLSTHFKPNPRKHSWYLTAENYSSGFFNQSVWILFSDMLPAIERCWFVGMRTLLRRRKCAVWRPSDYARWDDCFKEERAAVTVQARGIVCYTPLRGRKSTIMVSFSFHLSAILPASHYFPFMRTRRIWMWITGYYREFSIVDRGSGSRSRRIFDVLRVLRSRANA